jgi:putative ABC transport system permease protein
MLSIVIGVTAAVAINLGTATTRNAYKHMFAMVTGKATLEVESAGGADFTRELVPKIAAVPGVIAAAPLVERPTSMSLSGGEKRVRLQILGIDSLLDSTVRDYTISAGRQVHEGDELAVDEGFANYLGLKVGDEAKLLTKKLSKPFTIVGLVRPKSGASLTQTSMAFLPIDRAQNHFNSKSQAEQIDKIQIVTAPEIDPVEVQTRVAAILPEGLQVHRPSSNTQLMKETLLASEIGLWQMTLYSLLMAAFVILNTFLMNVTERRRQLSIMRAIGVVKEQVTGMLLAESMLLGVLGTALGIGIGVLIAWGVSFVLASAFEVQLPPLWDVITPTPFILGGAFGIGMAFIGALAPALLAARVSPLEGMNRSSGVKGGNYNGILAVVGGVLTVVSLIVMFLTIGGRLPTSFGVTASVPMLIGLVILDSLILEPQATFIAWLLKPFTRVEASLALKQVLRHPTRSALTAGVLFIAGSTGVGMMNSILDNVRNVHDWNERALVGDYFVRAMMPDMATGTAADLPDGLGEELEKVAHVTSVDGIAFVEAQVPEPTPEDPSAMLNVVVIVRKFVSEKPSFDLITGDVDRIREQLHAGQVVVGSVLAQKLGLKLGDKLPLQTKTGVQHAPICGIANEYMVGGLAVHMVRDQAVKWLGAEGVDGYIINAEAGHRDSIKAPLEEIARKYDVFLLSQSDIRNTVDNIVGGVEWSLWALVFIGFVVASFGVVNTLTMNVLEQTRELGLLRIVAMTKEQIQLTILMQALIIGGIGLPPGILLGVAVAYVNNLAMMPAFGHPIAFHLYPTMLVVTLIGALIIVLVAAIIPARRATQINLVDALHYE